MRRCKPKTIKLSRTDRHEVERLLGDGRMEQRIVRRGQVLLAMRNSKTLVSELCQRVGMSRIGIMTHSFMDSTVITQTRFGHIPAGAIRN